MTPFTTSIPEAGQIIGLGRSGAYEAARQGDIPTIKVGRRLFVPIRQLEKLLGLNAGELDHLAKPEAGKAA